MKKILLSLLLISNNVFADCDYTKIINNQDNTFTYSKDLHICVGQMKRDLLISQEQIDKLNKSLDLKDLVIKKSDERTDLWMSTSLKLEEKVRTIDQMQSNDKLIYFGLGVLTVFVAGYVASQTYRK